MPTWVQVVIAAAAVVTSIGVLIQKVIRPLLVAANRAEEMYRMQVHFMDVFEDAPQLLVVLREMSLQFKTNHGSSLRDVVNDIKLAADKAFGIAETLAVKVAADATNLAVKSEAAKELDDRDRRQLLRMEIAVDRLERSVDQNITAIARMEAATAVVASDLAASQGQADAVEGPAGAAADAAVKSPEAR